MAIPLPSPYFLPTDRMLRPATVDRLVFAILIRRGNPLDRILSEFPERLTALMTELGITVREKKVSFHEYDDRSLLSEVNTIYKSATIGDVQYPMVIMIDEYKKQPLLGVNIVRNVNHQLLKLKEIEFDCPSQHICSEFALEIMTTSPDVVNDFQQSLRQAVYSLILKINMKCGGVNEVPVIPEGMRHLFEDSFIVSTNVVPSTSTGIPHVVAMSCNRAEDPLLFRSDFAFFDRSHRKIPVDVMEDLTGKMLEQWRDTRQQAPKSILYIRYNICDGDDADLYEGALIQQKVISCCADSFSTKIPITIISSDLNLGFAYRKNPYLPCYNFSVPIDQLGMSNDIVVSMLLVLYDMLQLDVNRTVPTPSIVALWTARRGLDVFDIYKKIFGTELDLRELTEKLSISRRPRISTLRII